MQLCYVCLLHLLLTLFLGNTMYGKAEDGSAYKIRRRGLEKDIDGRHNVSARQHNSRKSVSMGQNEEDLNTTEVLQQDSRDLQQIIYKFDTKCQTDIQTMNSSCRSLLVKLSHLLKIELEIPYLQTRHMRGRGICGFTNPMIYDRSQEMCCDGIIHRKITGKEMCCSSLRNNDNFVVYDSSNELCCDGLVYPKTHSFMACCGNSAYDTRLPIGCCNGQLYNNKRNFCCDNQTLHHNIGRHNIHGDCCGSEPFDIRCYSCRRLFIHSKFDSSTQKCCHGRIRTIGKNRTVCCGKRLMDESKFHCTDNKIVARQVVRILEVGRRIRTTPKTYRFLNFTDVFKDNENVVTPENMAPTEDKEVNMTNILAMTTGRWVLNTLVALKTVWTTPKSFLVFHNADVPEDNKKVDTPEYMGPTENKKENTTNIIVVTSGLAVAFTITFLAMWSFWKMRSQTRKPEVCDVGHSNICANFPSVNLDQAVDLDPSEYIGEELESGYQSACRTSVHNSRISINYETVSNSNQTQPCIGLDVIHDKDNLMDINGVHRLGTDKTFPEASVSIDKPIKHAKENLTSELFSNAETQTLQNKETNQRDIFGRSYQHSQYLDKFSRTVTWQHSDTKMTLPASAVNFHTIYTLASSFDNIPDVCEKFHLAVDVRILSPIVEYCLTGCTVLLEHALVELPIINDGKCQIKVFKFCSDDGLNQFVELQSIPILKEENFSLDTFCIVKKDRALIYTKTFSGFFCATHGRREYFSLRAFLFGSYKMAMQNQEVRLSLYIADDLHQFKDYNKNMVDIEKCEGPQKPLKLPYRCFNGEKCYLTEDDYLEITASVTGGLGDTWEPKLHPEKNRPIERKQQIVQLADLMQCCRNFPLPHKVEWNFINKTGAPPSPMVQSVVDIECKLHDSRAKPTITSMYLDELKIRASDITEVPTEAQMVFGLKRYLAEKTEPSVQESIIPKLQEVTRRFQPGLPITGDLAILLNVMERNIRPAEFIRTISDILHDINAYLLLDILVCNKLIPEHVLPMSKQPYHPYTGNPPHGHHNETSASSHRQLIYHEDCRQELDTNISCSFDNRNERNGRYRDTHGSRPRPELRSRSNESQLAGLSQTSAVTSALHNTLDEPETTPKTLETQMTDDISLGHEEAACIIWPQGAQISSPWTGQTDTLATIADSGVRPKIDEGRQTAITSKEFVTRPTIQRHESCHFEALRQNNAITSELDGNDESETEPKSSKIQLINILPHRAEISSPMTEQRNTGAGVTESDLRRTTDGARQTDITAEEFATRPRIPNSESLQINNEINVSGKLSQFPMHVSGDSANDSDGSDQLSKVFESLVEDEN